ncbi:MAG TPA: cytochrome c biogenesis protein CcsA [Thermoanaerobaculia bacterium]|nr:cytochrome c biogenesis protein CcsA [Thermoanaerobaculia bacterium]
MDSFLLAATVLLPLLYLTATIAYGQSFFAESPRAGMLAPWVLRGALLLHAAYLAALWARYQQLPAASVSQATSLMSFALGLVYLVVEWRTRERSTGVWLVGLVLFFQLLASLLVGPPPPDRALFHEPLFALHVSFALLGYVAFAVAAVYGFLFLRLYRDLKAGRFGTFFGRLPPLAVLERMMVWALTLGFLAMTAGVTLGMVFVRRIYPDQWLTDPKILTSIALWLLYGLALLLRHLHQWQGRQTAVVSLAGLGTIIASLVTVNLLFTGFHGFR